MKRLYQECHAESERPEKNKQSANVETWALSVMDCAANSVRIDIGFVRRTNHLPDTNGTSTSMPEWMPAQWNHNPGNEYCRCSDSERLPG